MGERVAEEAVMIEEFPAYDITNHGRVFNLNTRREMKLSPTQHDDLTVGFTKEGRQYRYSVKGLVARAFCNFQYHESVGVNVKAFTQNYTERSNTPVLLDGNKYNLYFENIVWRPRWFAWRYSNQFVRTMPWFHYGPVQEINTGTVYDTYLAAAIDNGELCVDIRQSANEGYPVFPLFNRFSFMGKYTYL